MTEPLTVGSLFSGIGGIDLGLERAGMRVVWHAEVDPYCCRVLAKHWPNVPNLGDVTMIDWEDVPRVDLICGGYPCQPFSLAGARRGTSDARHLWPYMLDAVRHLQPRWVLLENVPGHLSLGFGRVLGDLAEIGYDAEWDCIPAAAVGAPHLRDRVFVVAYPHRRAVGVEPEHFAQRGGPAVAGDDRSARSVADTDGGGREEHGERHGDTQARESSPLGGDADRLRADVADTDSSSSRSVGDAEQGNRDAPLLHRGAPEPRGRRSDVADADGSGLPAPWERSRADGGTELAGVGWWAVEPDVGRVAHGVPHRVDRLRALGNAVVPQIAEHIGRLIVEACER